MERRASSPAEARARCPFGKLRAGSRDCRRDAGATFKVWQSAGAVVTRMTSGSFHINATPFLAALAVGVAGCCSGMTAETISTAKATWQGTIGTAVTITQSKGTKEFEGAKYVGFEFCQWRGSSGEFWEIADFRVPVMKLEPTAVTLFFSSDPGDARMLEHLPSEFRAGKARIARCLTSEGC